jgi:ribosomal protein S18 acetylase RimI-like enzyme
MGRHHWTAIFLGTDGRRSGIEDALDWAEPPHRERAANEAGGGGDAIGQARRTWSVRFAESRGYRPVRWFTEMVRDTLDDLPTRPLPAGLEIHPVRGEPDMRIVLAAMNEAFRDHWGHRALTEADVIARLEHPHTDPALWIVAWAGDEVAGAVIGVELVDDNAAFGWRRGWLATVGTRRPWRGRGVASALVVRSLELMRDRGLTSAALGVDMENPSGALGLYERLGFRTAFASWSSSPVPRQVRRPRPNGLRRGQGWRARRSRRAWARRARRPGGTGSGWARAQARARRGDGTALRWRGSGSARSATGAVGWCATAHAHREHGREVGERSIANQPGQVSAEDVDGVVVRAPRRSQSAGAVAPGVPVTRTERSIVQRPQEPPRLASP